MSGSVILPPRRTKGTDAHGDLLETPIRDAMIDAFNALPGVQAWGQRTGRLKVENRSIPFGLCVGSSDILGIVTCAVRWRDEGSDVIEKDCRRLGGYVTRETFVLTRPIQIGRFFALEVKRPGKRPTDAQEEFLALCRKFGAAGSWSDNVTDAVAWLLSVQRCEDLR